MLGLKRSGRHWSHWLGVAALTALLALIVVRGHSSQDAQAPVQAQGAQRAPRSVRSAPALLPMPAARQTTPAAPAGAPIIDEIIVEKPELCAGEETLITVRAHTPDASDAELHYRIGPGTGRSVPVRAWVDEQGRPPELEVTAFGKGNVATTVPVPALRLRPCSVGTFAVLGHRALPNRWGTFEFRAELREGGRRGSTTQGDASGVRPRRYVWTFGDGAREETRVGEVTHSYEDRAQDSLYSQFLVRVDILTGNGRALVARDALQLPNPAYEAWTRKGIVSLMVALDPPFPVWSASGRVEQGVRLRHHRPDPIVIESVRIVRDYLDGHSSSEAGDVAAILGTDTIPAGSGHELQASLDARAEPHLLSVTYYLRGKSGEGRPVVGSFSVMRPPARPTADNSKPVSDPQLVAKIRRARERLGKDVVSEEDLARLERQGEL